MVRLVLHVAEKPSVAKSLAAILSQNRCSSRQGPSKYNRLYDFDLGFRNLASCRHVVTSVTGHLMTTEFAAPYNNWRACAPRDLLCEDVSRVEWSVPQDKQELKRQLETEARRAAILVLWLDCDREGEAIAFEVVEVCGTGLDTYRAKFSSLDPAEVMRAYSTLGRPDRLKSEAVAARSELDLRSGAAFTRFQTFRLQGKFEGVGGQPISYGSCQFPTLGFIVERQNEIERFVPQAFWRVDVATDIKWNWRRKRVYDRRVAIVIYEQCAPHDLLVETVDSRAASKWRPVPLATVELQKRASRWLKLASAETMDIAESLYQRGYVSYPRTETEVFNENTDLRDLLERQRQDARWGGHVAKLLDDPPASPAAFQWPRKGSKDDQAHPPVHPTKAVVPGELNNRKEEQVYELIARHFVACCSKDATGRQTNVVARLGPEIYDAKGLVVEHRNYLDAYTYEKWQAVQLPPLAPGQKLQCAVDLAESKTAPPSALSEADLLALMDKHGIGTDATMAEHIKNVLTRDYAVRENGLFRPKPLGSGLVEAYDAMGERLNRPDLRAKMEADVAAIANGSKTRDAVVKDTLVSMRRCYDACAADAAKLDDSVRRRLDHTNDDAPDPSGFASPCGTCGGTMTLRVRDTGDGKRRYSLRCDACEDAWLLPDASKFATRQESCKICGYRVIQVSDESRRYTVCPRCVRQPPPGASYAGADFKCSDCTEDCPLASGVKGGDQPVATCFKCNDKPMFLRRAQNGRLDLRCAQACGGTIFIPEAVKSATVLHDAPCPTCANNRAKRTLRLRLSLNPSRFPPGTPLDPVVCVMCGGDTVDDIGIERRIVQPQQQTAPRRGGPQQQRRGGPPRPPRPAAPPRPLPPRPVAST